MLREQLPVLFFSAEKLGESEFVEGDWGLLLEFGKIRFAVGACPVVAERADELVLHLIVSGWHTGVFQPFN